MTVKRWCVSFLLGSLGVLLLLALTMWAADPFLQYRATDGKYYLSARFANPGILKNADYDAVVVGSSVTQNFSMQLFRDELGVNPVKATIGAMTLAEENDAVALADRASKATQYFICLDNSAFLSYPELEPRTFPAYLMDDNPLNDYRYLLGYEAWMRYLPVDAALCLADAAGITLPEKFRQTRSIDDLEYWQDDAEFGEDAVRAAYAGAAAPSSDAGLSGRLYEFSVWRLGIFLSELDMDPEKQYTFFFPPYSAVYWFECGNAFQTAYQDAKVWFTEAVSAYPNASVYDFQCMPVITDLSRYRDSVHYDAGVNNDMTRCFRSGDYRVTPETAADSARRLTEMLDRFRSEHADWLF